ncbi:unnamed protein product [Polarella glacialis]|uniref:RING-type domain-containing protein n=1 Tax=Polarella glacialis TaxID=89957 RepID=A0A813E002_POLGL|nr:unnamed protein product [Polarella glacialis]
MDVLLVTLRREDLGKAATENMRLTAQKIGCWLGFFRDGTLNWRDLKERLQAAREVEAAAAARAAPRAAIAPPAAAAAAAPVPAAADASECVVCLEKPPESALLPCGHRCVCETCADAVRSARPPVCPLCRANVQGACRIFI